MRGWPCGTSRRCARGGDDNVHRCGAGPGRWLETCPPLGTVFLDEIAEIEPAIQVKLLRVLQARTFHRLGETNERRFRWKLIAATNRDLAAEIEAGRFREDSTTGSART